MADTGYKGGSYAHADYSGGTDVDGIAVANSAAITTDAIDNSVTAARAGYSVSVGVVEDNTGAISGTVTVALLSSDFDPDSEGYQDPAVDPVWKFDFTPVQDDEITASPVFVDGATYPKFKVWVDNNSGQELAVTINLCPISVPVAS